MSLPDTDEALILLHNPRCSKSRQVKALLEERSVGFVERRYLDEPLDPQELEDLERRMGRPLREWTRHKESAFAESGLAEDSDDQAYREAVAERPILMERPILVRGRRAKVGRPPEVVLDLL